MNLTMVWSQKPNNQLISGTPLVLRWTLPFLVILSMVWLASHGIQFPEETLSLSEQELQHLLRHHKTPPPYLEESFFVSGTVAQLGNGHLYLSNGTRVEFRSGRIPGHLQPGADATLRVQIQTLEKEVVLETRRAFLF